MIEIVNKLHIQRLFATELPISDLWKPVYYAGYEGDPSKIPFYYKKIKGETAISDLSKPLDVLVSEMKSNTRNEIRRAEREGIGFEADCSYDDFIPFYNAFSESKGLKDRVSIQRLCKYNKNNKTIITKAYHNDTILAMHATVVNFEQKLSFLLFSCSPRLDADVDKKMIGWGNRYLHYKDFEYLKALGIETYNWSGVCTDPKDECYSIGQFKLSFGGELKTSIVLETPLYVVLTELRKFIWSVKRISKRR